MPVNAISAATPSGFIIAVNDFYLRRQLMLAEQATRAAALAADQAPASTSPPGAEIVPRNAPPVDAADSTLPTEAADSLKAQLARNLESELALNLFSNNTVNALAASAAFASLLAHAKQSVEQVLAENQAFQAAANNTNALNAILTTSLDFASPNLSDALTGSALLSAEGALLATPGAANAASSLLTPSASAADLSLQIALAAAQTGTVATPPQETVPADLGLPATTSDLTASGLAASSDTSAAQFLQALLAESTLKAEGNVQATVSDSSRAAIPAGTTNATPTANAAASNLPQTNTVADIASPLRLPTTPNPATPAATTVLPATIDTAALQQQIAQNAAQAGAANLLTSDPAYAMLVASLYARSAVDHLHNGNAIDFVSPASAAVPNVAPVNRIVPIEDLPSS